MKHICWFLPFVFGLWLTGCPGFGDEEREGLFDTVPEQPNFEEHIAPLTAAYCNKCHSATPTNGAPPGFRTDICESTGGDDGARARSSRFAARVNNAGAPMPPASETAKPGDIDKQIFQKWHETGALCNANDAPVMDSGIPGDRDASPNSTFAEQITPVFESNGCLSAGCHGNGSAAAGLDLSTESGLMTTGSNAPMISRCDPDNSYLVLKLRTETLPAGTLMPIGGAPVSDGDLNTIKTWIADGADDPGSCDAVDDVGVADTDMAMDTTSSTDTGAADVSPDLPDAPEPIEHPSFIQVSDLFALYNCSSDYCHGSSGGSANLDLSTLEGLREGGENGQVVSPCDPTQSNLFLKLREETLPFGDPMPLGGDPIANGHLETIRNWIADGATATFDASICNPGDSDPPLFEGVTSVNEMIDGASCELFWNPAFDAVTPAAALRYRIYAGRAGDIDRNNPVTTAAGATSYLATGLTTGETFEFDVRAIDQADNESIEPRVVSCTPGQ